MEINKKRVFVLGVHSDYGYIHKIYFADSKDELEEYLLNTGMTKTMYYIIHSTDLINAGFAKSIADIRDEQLNKVIN